MFALISTPIKGRSIASLFFFKLVGPDCRTLLEIHAAILACLSDKIEAIHGDVIDEDFVQRHSRVIAPLALVRDGTRRVTGSGADGLWGGVEGELRPPPDPKRAHRRGACAVVCGQVRLRHLWGGRLRGASRVGLDLP